MVGHVACEAEKICADQAEQARAYELVSSMLRTAAADMRLKIDAVTAKPNPPVITSYRDERNVPRTGYEYGGKNYYEHAARSAYEAYIEDLSAWYESRRPPH
jgi:hypothetical protein